jgi:agmatine deiminase
MVSNIAIPSPGDPMPDPTVQTPAAAGFVMPAEWEAHAGCLMQWPSRLELWTHRFEEACADYAVVARAIAAFEPVVMVCNPGQAQRVRDLCGQGVTPLEIPINDSWARDSGPAFVRDGTGTIKVVSFGFNAWGNRWHPHDDDDRLAAAVAARLGLDVFQAPFVLEGGSILVDGEGTVITTEQCLLDPNRNPTWSREELERGLCDYLGATTVIWLPHGHSLDVGPAGTDGHIDGVAAYVAPGHVMLEAPTDPASPDTGRALANLAALLATPDARGRTLQVTRIDPGSEAGVSLANHYVANGAVIVPADGNPDEARALAELAQLYPGREVVAVPGETLAFGGGGPHCITQQIPCGVDLGVL